MAKAKRSARINLRTTKKVYSTLKQKADEKDLTVSRFIEKTVTNEIEKDTMKKTVSLPFTLAKHLLRISGNDQLKRIIKLHVLEQQKKKLLDEET